MTGWRLGWMVVPDVLVPVVERLAKTCSSAPAPCPSTRRGLLQLHSLAEYQRRRAEFKARRDFFIPALNKMGLRVPVTAPDGAFYAWSTAPRPAASSASRTAAVRLRAHAPRPCGGDTRARFRHRSHGTLRVLFHRQLDGPPAERSAAPYALLA